MAELKEIYLDCHSVEQTYLHCPIETEIALFCFKYIKLNHVKIFLFCSEDSSDICQLPISTLNELNVVLVEVSILEFNPELAACKRPSARSCDGGFDLILSGLCNVLRQAIRRAYLNHPDDDKKELLGFHENFLKACAEVSPWTKFCESLLPNKIKDLLKKSKLTPDTEEDEKYIFPEEIIMLNNNFKQPVKISNINKKRQEVLKTFTGDEWNACKDFRDVVLEHKFAEASATNMTITDLVLFPCIHEYMVSEAWIPTAVQTRLPLVYEWYLRMFKIPEIRNVSELFGFIQPAVDTCDPIISQVAGPGVSDAAVRDQDKSKKRAKTRPEDVQLILNKLEKGNISPVTCVHPCIDDMKLAWDSFPEAVNPSTGDLPQKRLERKCQQLENMVKAVSSIANRGDVIVDFCSGGGHVGILLAYHLHNCQIILIENKEESLQRAVSRINKLHLTNIKVYQSNLDYYCGGFNIGVCLHACGSATDMVLEKCLQSDAAFVICPCCYGSISDTTEIKFPRSAEFRDAAISKQDHLTLARAADQTEIKTPKSQQGKYCMQLIDTDRRLYAEKFRYNVKLCSLSPLTCTPKNNLLIGVKS